METRVLVIILSIVVLSSVELLKPAEKNQTPQGKIKNLLYIACFILLGYGLSFLLSPIVYWAHGTTTTPTPLSFILTILAFIFIGDVLFYFYHRAQHTFPTLWAIHELHHTERELNSTSSLRTHFLESPIQAMIISSSVVFLLHPPQVVLLTLSPLLTFWLFFTHANIRLHLKGLTKIVTGPQTHRIHHSIEEKHRNKNFAQFFPVIDIIFGTYYHPSNNEFPKTGLSNKEGVPFLESLLVPFKTWIKNSYIQHQRRE